MLLMLENVCLSLKQQGDQGKARGHARRRLAWFGSVSNPDPSCC